MHLLSANQSISHSMIENYEDNPDSEETMKVFQNIYFEHLNKVQVLVCLIHFEMHTQRYMK